VLCLSAAGCGDGAATADDYYTKPVVFPNGTRIRAELAMHPKDVMRGMKYRDTLARDRGMLFFHGEPGFYPYWMYEVKVPLDMIWMDKDRKIVQIVHKAPPCPGPPDKCMSYGGQFSATYILELPAGTAAENGLRPGMILEF